MRSAYALPDRKWEEKISGTACKRVFQEFDAQLEGRLVTLRISIQRCTCNSGSPSLSVIENGDSRRLRPDEFNKYQRAFLDAGVKLRSFNQAKKRMETNSHG